VSNLHLDLPNWPFLGVIFHRIYKQGAGLNIMEKFKVPAIVAITAIVVAAGTLLATGLLNSQDTSGSTMAEQSGFLGHVTLVATHPDGTIFAYRQGDNTILDNGANCIGNLVFGAQNSTGSGQILKANCAGVFKYIAVGTNATATSVAARGSGAFLQELASTNRGDASSTPINYGVTNSTGTGSSVAAHVVVAQNISIGSSGTIATVGLADSATVNGGTLFARQQLGSTIAVNSGDTIKVTWSIDIVH
jgi:hypothetical protein